MNYFNYILILFLLGVANQINGQCSTPETRLYVNLGATGSATGDSWANAFTDLQAAIDCADDGDTIWVSQEMYIPIDAPDGTPSTGANDPNNAFHLNKNIAIYGGFSGTETMLSQRNPTTNITILSGAFYTNHVIITFNLNNAAVIDGFTITGGNANGSSIITYDGNQFEANHGGGMYNNLSSPTLRNLIFSDNSASYSGGGILNNSSSPILTNVIFYNNSATLGAGATNISSSPSFTNVIFSNNNADYGGGIFNFASSSPTITNGTFTQNFVADNNGQGSGGAGIFNFPGSSSTIYNTVFYNNINEQAISDIEGDNINNNSSNNASDGIGGNINSGIGFVNLLTSPFENAINPIGVDGLWMTSDDGLMPTTISSIVNAGDDSKNIETFDISGAIRKKGIIDIGAYELNIIDDVGVLNITKPNEVCHVSTTDTISITIVNFSPIDSITNIPVSYQVLHKPIVNENYIGIIPPNGSVIYTFSQTVDLSKSWNTNIRAWTNLSDNNPQNDTMQWDINCQSLDSIGTPYVSNQVVIQYVDGIANTALIAIRDSIINAGGNLLDTTNCNLRLDLWSLPDTLYWDGIQSIGAEGQGERMSTTTAKIKEVDLNYLSDSLNGNGTEPMIITQPSTGDTTPVKIAILDTGFDDMNIDTFGHLFLDTICSICDNFQEVVVGYDFINMDIDPIDDNGHGSKVANVMLKYANTVNFKNFKIIPLKVLDHEGQGSLWNIALGTIVAEQLDADIVNASFGWLGNGSEILDTLIQIVGEDCYGLFVASAGNENNNNDSLAHHPSNTTLLFDHVVSVGSDSLGHKPLYSNYGKSVDIAAPGDIVYNGNVIGSGTSYAAPYISIHAAIKMAENEHRTAIQMKSCLNDIHTYGISPLMNSTLTDTLILNVFNSSTTWTFDDCINTLTIDTTCKRLLCPTFPVNTKEPYDNNFSVNTYPNPFNNRINFDITFDQSTAVYFRIFDMTGRSVFDYEHTSQEHQIIWNGTADGTKLPSGVYFGHILTEKGSYTIKVLKLE